MYPPLLSIISSHIYTHLDMRVTDLSCGDFVLAKVGDHPYWPAVVGQCCFPEWMGEWVRVDTDEVWVYFYNSYEADWVHPSAILPFTQSTRVNYFGSALLKGAVMEALDRIKEHCRRPAAIPVDETLLRPGTLVLARHTNNPPWPALVEPEAKSGGRWKFGPAYHVKFLVEDSVQWVSAADIQIYSKIEAERTTVRPCNINYNLYKAALEAAQSIVAEQAETQTPAGRAENSM